MHHSQFKSFFSCRQLKHIGHVILEEGEFNQEIIYIKLVIIKYAALNLILKGILSVLRRLGDMT